MKHLTDLNCSVCKLQALIPTPEILPEETLEQGGRANSGGSGRGRGPPAKAITPQQANSGTQHTELLASDLCCIQGNTTIDPRRRTGSRITTEKCECTAPEKKGDGQQAARVAEEAGD